MTYQLGRRPPKRAAALKLADYLTIAVPDHPASADHFAEVSDWGLWGNDTYRDCGPVSAANSRKLITRYLTGTEAEPTQDDVFALYKASGNPDFDPNDPGGPGDGGVDMQTMCEALVSVGIGGVKALGFAKVDVSNLAEVDAAIAIFGSLLLGVNLEDAQKSQTGLWDYRQSPEWGGHAVLSGRYTLKTQMPGWQGTTMTMMTSSQDRTGVVTWAQVVDATDSFLSNQLEEAWVVIWPEHLGSTEFLQGVDLASLAADYQELTGRPFPAPVPPQPVPTPPPPGPAPKPQPSPDPLHELADLLKQWWTTVEAWMHKHGLG